MQMCQVLVEPGTPHGSNIICQMRSLILWMEKRKCLKSENNKNIASKDLVAHRAVCILLLLKYCHFVQRLERTSTQRAYYKGKWNYFAALRNEKKNPKLEASHLEKSKKLYTSLGTAPCQLVG